MKQEHVQVTFYRLYLQISHLKKLNINDIEGFCLYF